MLSAVKKNKAKEGDWEWGGGQWGTVLHRMVREALSDKVISGQRSEGHERVSISHVLTKSDPGRENS